MTVCQMPGCTRPVVNRAGLPGARAKYCDDVKHDGHALQAHRRAQRSQAWRQAAALSASHTTQWHESVQQLASLTNDLARLLATYAETLKQVDSQSRGCEPDPPPARWGLPQFWRTFWAQRRGLAKRRRIGR